MKKKILYTILTIELTVICILIIGYTQYKTHVKLYNSPPVPKIFNASLERNKWKQYMQQVGSHKAYTDFKRVYSKSRQTLKHSAMHQIGALLYELEGLKGIAICDQSFTHGCYHGFFGNAIQKNGLSDIKSMDTACINEFGEKNSGCQHGIGHGLLAYLGNDKLVEALQACDTLSWEKPIGGCKAGVFMEYNFSTLTHISGFKPRILDTSSPFGPCSELEEQYQYSCYFEQPEWWNSVYSGNYQKIGELCETLSTPNIDSCYLGTGSIAIRSSRFNVNTTVKKCDAIKSEMGNLLCKAGAQWAFQAYGKEQNVDLKRSGTFCKTVSPSLYTLCIEKSYVES